MKREQVRTSIHEYAHADRLGRVTLVGMSHTAQPSYFRTVKSLIDAHVANGGVVHYESVHEPTAEELASATPRERVKSRGITRAIERLSRATDDLIGLVRQSSMLPAEPGWHSPDVSHLDIARLIDDQTVIDISRDTRQALKEMNANRAQRLRLDSSKTDYSLRYAQMLIAEYETPSSPDIGSTSAFLRMVLGLEPVRDQRQLAAIDRHASTLPDVDVLATWGDNHLDSIGSGLLDRGYTKTSQSELVAVDLWDLEVSLGVASRDPYDNGY